EELALRRGAEAVAIGGEEVELRCDLVGGAELGAEVAVADAGRGGTTVGPGGYGGEAGFVVVAEDVVPEPGAEVESLDRCGLELEVRGDAEEGDVVIVDRLPDLVVHEDPAVS